MPRKVQQIPDYFTPEEAAALVEGAPSYPTRMAFRLMLKTGLRVSEALALRRVDLRLDQDPPIIVVRADSPGNKARKGREVPVPADLVESLHDLASFHNKDRQRPMLDMSRWRLSQVMKESAMNVGIDPARAHPHAFRHTYGRNCVLKGVPIPVLQKWLGHQSLKDTQRYVELAGGASRMGVATVTTTIIGEETTRAPTPSHGRASKRVYGEDGSIRRTARISKASTGTVKNSCSSRPNH